MECQYCGRICKNSNSQRNHERLCKHNPNRQYTHFSSSVFEAYRKSGTHMNGTLKARSLGLPEPKITPEGRKKLSERNKTRTAEFYSNISRKVSETVKQKVINGEWHTSLAKRMHYKYKGVSLHGKWELKYAMWLDDENIPWVRNKDQFDYVFKGVQRKYTPDFYLPDTDEYVEIKGYKTDKDEAKWTQFSKKLTVITGKDLKRLGILNNNGI